MNQHVQTLEGRTLFSAVPVGLFNDISALQTDAASFKTALGQSVPVLMADTKAIAKDLHALPATAQNRTLAAKLRVDEAKSVAMLKTDAVVMFKAGTAKVGKAVMDAMLLSAHPTNAVAQAHLSADVAALQAMDSALSAKFLADATNASNLIGQDLTALAAANPGSASLQSDVLKTQDDMTSALTALQSHFQTIQGDFQHLVNDLSAML